jgi:hypothetical protein
MPIAQFLLDVHEHEDRTADPSTKFPPLISSLVPRVAVLAPFMLHHHARLRCCLLFHYDSAADPARKIAPKTTCKLRGTLQGRCHAMEQDATAVTMSKPPKDRGWAMSR